MMKKNVLEYKSYHTVIEFDSETNTLRGKIEGINDYVDFYSTDVNMIEKVSEYHKNAQKEIDEFIELDRIETEKLESSEIPDEPGNPVDPDTPETPECDCICHETGFLNRILAIVYKIFLKLLDTSPLCECGVAHY